MATIPGGPIGGTWDGDPDIYSPAAFAAAVAVGQDWPDALDHVAPGEMAEYRQARGALFAELPILRSVPAGHPIHPLEGVAFAHGVAVGAAAERQRLALLGPVRLCRRCEGVGLLRGGEADDEELTGVTPDPCPDCGGRGTVPPPCRRRGWTRTEADVPRWVLDAAQTLYSAEP